MPIHKKSKKQIPPIKGGQLSLNGLQSFKKSLERDFFCDCETFCGLDNDKITTNVALTMRYKFSLSESLFYLTKGNFESDYSDNIGIAKFENAIEDLFQKNQDPIELIEVTFYFTDTTLIISQLYPGSIMDNLRILLSAVSENLVHFTKGLTEMPFEIFIPVLEEQELKPETKLINREIKNEDYTGYLDYWALYFESNADKDPVIYNVRTKNITKEPFFFLDYQ